MLKNGDSMMKHKTSTTPNLTQRLKSIGLMLVALLTALLFAVLVRLFVPASDVQVDDADLLYDYVSVPDEQNAYFAVDTFIQNLENNHVSLRSLVSWSVPNR